MSQINNPFILDLNFNNSQSFLKNKPLSQKKKLLQNQFECTLSDGSPSEWKVYLTSKSVYLSQDGVEYQSIDLTYDLKLQILHYEQKNIKSPLIGFSLKNEQIGFNMSFFSKNNEVLRKWIDQLTKKINRIGFRQYFKPVQKMGKGGFATIYQVQGLLDGKRYAAKAHPKGQFKQDPRLLKGFKNQVKILRKLNHKNSIKLYGVYESENTIYILIQLLKGGNILQRMFKRDGSFGLSQQQIKKIIQGSLTGLNYIHSQGIIHRDIKLQNIMLRNMHCFDPVIVDFGFSTIEAKNEMDNGQSIVFPHCGTPGYIAPQLFQNSPQKINQNLSPKCDVFALGVTFYMLITKKPLFSGKDPKQVFQNNKKMLFDLQPNIEEKTKDLILKMIEVSPEQRVNAMEALCHQYFNEQQKLNQFANMKTGQGYQQCQAQIK